MIVFCCVIIAQYDFYLYLALPLYCFSDDLPRRRPPQIYKPPTAEMIAYLDFSVSTTGMLTGVKVRHMRFIQHVVLALDHNPVSSNTC